ncbi:hypothetical protein A2G96_18805 [Cupriavidus nantongensis]|uniref:Virulence-associated protein E-like domain-containing protein n=2 Tax=Cupriavidus nantongensis TaxID=1796606 RepID=A0A142JNG9_9BURK|nr:hypothetical protein A2G96_18805 [Cupriavidus nantongensis]
MQSSSEEVKEVHVSKRYKQVHRQMREDEAKKAMDDDDIGLPMKDAGISDEAKEAEARTKQAVLRLAENKARADEMIAQARKEPDLKKRAKALVALQAINFPEVKAMANGYATQPLHSHPNYWAVFSALFGDELPARPHFDSFRGQSIIADSSNDNEIKVINGNYSVVELTMAMSATGLTGLKAPEVRAALLEYTKGAERNSLQERIKEKMPEWDGVERMNVELINLFKCFDTPLNRDFGRYFWLSLYSRMMYPGAFAPMVLSLFGAQGSGKSYMSKLICEEVTGNPRVEPTDVDMSENGKEFIRKITGTSVIANIGEMVGMARGDLNKIKTFVTRTADTLDHKYAAPIQQPRQWVIVLDGNKYEGLQRDDTGNRRFYPIFCGQLQDENGQHKWDLNFKVNYEGFRERFWQIMAECKAWIESHDEGVGMMKDSDFLQHIGYRKFVDSVIVQVQEFSREEMARGSGVIADPVLDTYLIPAIAECNRQGKLKYRKGGKFGSGDFIKSADLIRVLAAMTREVPKEERLKPRMAALGAPFTNGPGGFIDGCGAYFWKDQPKGTALKLIESDHDGQDEDHNTDYEGIAADNRGGF